MPSPGLRPCVPICCTRRALTPCRNWATESRQEWNGWSSSQKELRILDTLEPLIQSHRLVVDRKVIESDYQVLIERPQYSLIHQMTRMCRLKGAIPHEDRLEALSMACSYWTEKVKVDKDRALQNYRDDLLDKELRRFIENATHVGRSEGTSDRDLIWRNN